MIGLVGETAEIATTAFGPVAGGALIGVDTVDSCSISEFGWEFVLELGISNVVPTEMMA